jgi:hypothetical protein
MHGQRRSRSSQIGAMAKAISSTTPRQQLDRVCTVKAQAFADDALPHAVGAGTLAPCIERGQRELEALDRQRPGYLDGGREGVKERCSCSWASLRAQSPEFTISRLYGSGLPRPRVIPYSRVQYAAEIALGCPAVAELVGSTQAVLAIFGPAQGRRSTRGPNPCVLDAYLARRARARI